MGDLQPRLEPSFIQTCREGLDDFNQWADTTCCCYSFCTPVGAVQLTANVSCAVFYNTLGIFSFLGSAAILPLSVRIATSQFRQRCFTVGSEAIDHSWRAGLHTVPLVGAHFAQSFASLEQARDEQAKQIVHMKADMEERLSQIQKLHATEIEAQRMEVEGQFTQILTQAQSKEKKQTDQIVSLEAQNTALHHTTEALEREHAGCAGQKEELKQRIDSLTKQLGLRTERLASLRPLEKKGKQP